MQYPDFILYYGAPVAGMQDWIMYLVKSMINTRDNM